LHGVESQNYREEGIVEKILRAGNPPRKRVARRESQVTSQRAHSFQEKV